MRIILKVVCNKLLIVIVFLFTLIGVSAQEGQTKKNFYNRVEVNSDLLATDPDKAFLQIDVLLQEAIRLNDRISELSLIERNCWYYNHKSDIENLISAAQLLKQKAVEYKEPYFEAIAHTYTQCAYTTNQLYDSAIVEFKKAMAILEKEDSKNRDIIIAKYNAYTYLANLYNHKKEGKKALQNLLYASKELEKFNDTEIRKSITQYHNYANIASCYIEINIDSAEYYVKKSMNIELHESQKSSYILFSNYTTLGHIERIRENYKQALVYYHKAEAITPRNSKSNIVNRSNLYERLQFLYESLSDTTNANLYRLKSKEAQLDLELSKNKSLHKIIEDTPERNNFTSYLILVISMIVVFFSFYYRLYRKNKSLLLYEEKSQQYLNKFQGEPQITETAYMELLEKVKNDDPDFFETFNKIFPHFEEKIKAINESVVPTEMEFCALLKLNFPTKDIARYKNLEPRSVQSKKYRIRKKLNIPANEDIYFWFSKI